MHSGIEHFTLTAAGRELIPILRKERRDPEADVMEFIDRHGPVTVEQLAYSVRQNQLALQSMLKSYVENRWVKKQSRPASPI
jgi:hypothetical protein